MRCEAIAGIVRWSRCTWLLLWLIGVSGCQHTTVVTAPQQVSDPAHVYLLDHGRHASLMLPTTDGGMTRWAYGDWDWYAQQERDPFVAISALLAPSEAALARARYTTSVASADATRVVQVGSRAGVAYYG